MDMIEAVRVLAQAIDFPVTVLGFVWALRMIERMHCEVISLLQSCLENERREENDRLAAIVHKEIGQM